MDRVRAEKYVVVTPSRGICAKVTSFAIIAANFQNYIKGSLFQTVMADAFGEGIFATDGEVWNLQRKTTR